MIEVSFSSACILYLFLTLGGLVTIGSYFYIKKKDLTKFESSKLYLCEYCQHAYIDDIDQVVTTCPQCHLINKEVNC